jgi:hypothetical protein
LSEQKITKRPFTLFSMAAFILRKGKTTITPSLIGEDSLVVLKVKLYGR